MNNPLVHMVLWMLEKEVLKLKGLQQVTLDDGRWNGQQDAIDMIEASIAKGMSIGQADIERVVKEVRARHKMQGN